MVETTPNWSQLGVGVVPHVKIWVEAVIPIDGIGSQSHLAAGNAGGVKAAVDALAGTGVLEVAITGSDITGAASDDYWVVTDVCLRVETCVGITTWGVSDGPTLSISLDMSRTGSLESQTRHKASPFSSLRRDTDRNFADIPVCLCSLVSALCDSAAFNASSVLVSTQTGNTVFLALGAAPGFRPVRVAAAEAMARRDKASPEPRAFVVIVLLAFRFGCQIVASRQLGFNEVPANVLTSVYCGLFSDPHILAPWRENPKRNRRAPTAVFIVLRAIAGGWLGRSDAGWGSALWIVGGVKFLIGVAWLSGESRRFY
ncbi:hypothetical protein DL763_010774 [Monosporascus cannonballus]|nr:hypothetical protein DL763_010774 [Monosporascus cannonballus]